MWVLVIIMLTAIPGVDRVTVLKTFPSADACWVEQKSIASDMATSYPNDHDFIITCQPSNVR